MNNKSNFVNNLPADAEIVEMEKALNQGFFVETALSTDDVNAELQRDNDLLFIEHDQPLELGKLPLCFSAPKEAKAS